MFCMRCYSIQCTCGHGGIPNMLGQGIGMVNPQQQHSAYMEAMLRQYQGMMGTHQELKLKEPEKKKNKKLLLLRRTK